MPSLYHSRSPGFNPESGILCGNRFFPEELARISLAEFFASEGEKSLKSVFSGDMRLGKNSSQPANVRASHGSECAAAGCSFFARKASGFTGSRSRRPRPVGRGLLLFTAI